MVFFGGEEIIRRLALNNPLLGEGFYFAKEKPSKYAGFCVWAYFSDNPICLRQLTMIDISPELALRK